MIIIVDFCNTLVPFNTTFEFFKLICNKNILFKIIWFTARVLSRFGIFIEEKKQLKFFKFLSPKIYDKSLKKIASKIDNEYNTEVFKEVERFKSNGAFVVINTATFEDFFKYSQIIKFSDKIIASTYNEVNSGEMKLKNLINLDLLNFQKKIVFSDSFREDSALFLIGDVKNYVLNGKIFRI